MIAENMDPLPACFGAFRIDLLPVTPPPFTPLTISHHPFSPIQITSPNFDFISSPRPNLEPVPVLSPNFDLMPGGQPHFNLTPISRSNLWQRRFISMESNATMNADLELSENGINGVIGVNEEALAETGQRQMVTQFRDISREESPFQSHNKSRSSSTVGTSISEEQSARLAALVSKYGYQLVKENGQRKLHAPPEWQWPLPARGCEVFIGKLPRDVYEDELIPLFEKCGQIYEMRLMMDFSGANRGYAFVTYTAREEAKRACTELNNYEIRRGRHIGVVLSVDNCRLFVGGIPRNRSKEEVKVEMSKLTEGVMDVILYPSAADKTKNRGFAFVEYESHRAAAKARRKLLPNRVQLWGSVIAVDWAEPEQEVDEATMSQVKVLYVRNLMISTTEDTLRSVFEQASGTAGCIERVKKMRDFAFVHFGTRDQALRARDVLNGAELEGAVIEVVLSKPPYQSNIVRCMKKLQKSGAPRTDNVGTRGNDDFMTAAMRQMYAVDPVTMNNILACTAAPLIPPTSIDQANAQGTNPMINVATALTGLPLIDQYACLSQNLLDRQMSYPGAMGTGNGSKQTGLTEFQITNGNGGRAIRGAAGMRSAGFQAMINNTLRQGGTARRKFSEQLYDCILNQHQQQPPHIQNQQDQQSVLAQHQQGFVPPPGVVLVPTGPGLPGMALWRPIMATPTAAGYVPFIPTGPFAIPAPANVPMVSESSQQNGGRVTTASRVPTTTTGAVSVAQSSSPPIQETQQQQQLAGNAAIYPTAQFFVNGASGAMPIPNYQQGCYVGFE